MRSLTVLILLVGWIGSCGPSSKEVAMAKVARYRGDKLAVYAGMKSTIEGKYEISQSDETALRLVTKGRWHTPDGLVNSAHSEGDVQHRVDKSLNIAIVAELVPDGSDWVVRIEPLILRHNAGMPQPDKVRPNDASLPGWVSSMLDQLALDIHKALAAYEVKAPGGIPATQPPAAPPNETPQPPPAGSNGP